MWQTPKTDWKSEDYLNLESDFTRIEGNIHEIVLWAQKKGAVIDVNEHLTWSKDDFLTVEEMDRVIANLDYLIDTIPTPWIPTIEQYGIQKRRLDADGMNQLEGTIKQFEEVLREIAALIDAEGKQIFDSKKQRMLCKASFPPAVQYHSAYSGNQIDLFINQIKEWNNGEL